MTSLTYFGIDVSKAHLDVADQSRFLKRYSNDRSGIAQIVRRFARRSSSARVIVESTGIYSLAICEALADAGISVFLVQPGRVRHFALSQGWLAKNDRIDARAIASFGASSSELIVFVPPCEILREIRALVDRRDQLVDDRKREKCRLEATRLPKVRQHIQNQIAHLSGLIGEIEHEIDMAFQKDVHLQKRRDVLQSVSGVAAVTSSVLVAQLPELGHVSRQAIAALAGLAPYVSQSGDSDGKREIYGGRARVRSALYMAVVAAVSPQNKGFLVPHYEKLLARGKLKKVAQIACARKLLIHLNSLMREAMQPA